MPTKPFPTYVAEMPVANTIGDNDRILISAEGGVPRTAHPSILADAIRAEVAVDADRAQQAADALAADREKIQQAHSDNLSNIPHVVEQVDEAIPDRPAGYRWCYWHCWDNPAANMSVRDVWLKLKPPTPPDGITRSNFKLVDQLDGTLRVDVSGIPDYHPPLLGVAYRFDTETVWTPAGITGNGSFITRALTDGAHTLEISAQNFLGHSTVNEIYAFSILTDGSIPTQNFTGYSGALTNLDNWLASANPFVVSGGKVRMDERNITRWNYLDLPFGTSFFIEAQVSITTVNNQTRVYLGSERMYFQLAPTRAWVINGGSTGLSGTLAVNTATVRLEYTPTTISVFADGALAGQAAHAVSLAGGRVGIGVRNDKQSANWNTIYDATWITAIRAGKLA